MAGSRPEAKTLGESEATLTRAPSPPQATELGKRILAGVIFIISGAYLRFRAMGPIIDNLKMHGPK